MDTSCTMGNERSLKRAAFIMCKHPREGDLLMDAPEKKSWGCWLRGPWTERSDERERVRAMKQPRVRIEWAHTKPREGGRHPPSS